jgi:hypothetical protein
LTQTWSGKNNAGNVIDGPFTWAVAANTTTVVAGTGAGGERAQPYYVAASAGGNKLEFFQDGKKVTSVKPSFLFNVKQYVDFDQRPPDVNGEPQLPEGSVGTPSQVEVRFTPAASVATPAVVSLQVTASTQETGHNHAPSPQGIFLDAPDTSAAYTINSTLLHKVTDSIGAGSTALSLTGAATPVKAYYVVPIASGKYTFKVVQGGRTLTSADLQAEVPGLQALEDAMNALKVDFYPTGTKGEPVTGKPIYLYGETPTHPKNHFATPEFNQALIKAAYGFYQETGETLWVNDQSLVKGGKFDVDGNFIYEKSHVEHRLGDTADITTKMIFKTKYGAENTVRDKTLERHLKNWGLAVYGETKAPHYHLRPLQRKP